MTISFEGNSVTIGQRTVEFDARVREVDEHGDLVFVRLAWEDYEKTDPDGERNIIALDREGNVRWRIQTPPSSRTVRGRRISESYAGIDPNTGDADRPVVAYDTSGSCWKVDVETGKVSDPVFSR